MKIEKTITEKTFEKNLKTKADFEFEKFTEAVATAVRNVSSNYGVNISKLDFRFSEHYNSFDRGNTPFAHPSSDCKKYLEEHFVERSLNQFQEALNNFAWAVENQQQ